MSLHLPSYNNNNNNNNNNKNNNYNYNNKKNINNTFIDYLFWPVF